jgi:hypothetical protein
VVYIVRVFVDDNTFRTFDRETGVDPHHFGGLGPGLLNLSRLRVGGGEPSMGPLIIGHAHCEFSAQMHRLPIILEYVMGRVHKSGRNDRLKG